MLASGHFHGRFWVNNPDALILRDTPSPHRGDLQPEHTLSQDELELEITALALSGGVMMLTDDKPDLPAGAGRAVGRLPPWPAAAAPVPGDLMHPPYPTRYLLPVKTKWGAWFAPAIRCFGWKTNFSRSPARQAGRRPSKSCIVERTQRTSGRV